MTNATGTSAADPMTPEQVAEARALGHLWSEAPLSNDNPAPLLARAYREMERRAEAMAAAIGAEKANDVPRPIALAFAEWRTLFPKPQEPRT